MNTVFGQRWPALILVVVFVVVAAYTWARPLYFLVVGIAGLAEKLATDATLAAGIKHVFTAYLDLLKWMLVAVVTFCFVMGTIPFKENTAMAFVLPVALGVVGLFMWAWPELFKGTWARKSVYAFAVGVAIYALLSQIPGAVWVKYIGFAPSFAPTATEQTLYEIRKAQEKNRVKSDDDSLQDILERVRAGNVLTAPDERLVMKKEAEAKTVKALAGTAVDKLSGPDSSLSLTTVWETTKKNLIWILLLCAVVYGVGKLVGGKWATATALVAGFVLGLCFVVAPIGAQFDGPSEASKKAEKAMTLTMPAGGYSNHVVPPVGHFTRFIGHGYTIHCVYSDSTEGIVGDPAKPCKDGPMVYQYLRNTTDKVNTVSYMFIR